ncbi:hypothetical protein L873DRAFT_1790420 [Choiromyces venosus 120613-1]|uniref:Uncharacterized protein n=1 Tax=Choiromyces venosus 120613-1 TaxID=1336337 RepID=A0A3N4JQ85_9PEZI|nr:hypothetical protein L873DRAFT_1790420 [Choiromyces venosus 120613-1]
METLIFFKMLDTIQAKYRRSIDGLQEEIDALSSDLDQLRVPPAQPPTTTESAPDTQMAPESTSAPAQEPASLSAPTPTSVGAPSWATVTRKGKKKAPTTPKPTPAAKPSPLQEATLPSPPWRQQGFCLPSLDLWHNYCPPGTPATQPLIHGLPTSHSPATIATELTTYNSGLALNQQPRWLTPDESHAGKAASSIVITITGPKAPLFVSK